MTVVIGVVGLSCREGQGEKQSVFGHFAVVSQDRYTAGHRFVCGGVLAANAIVGSGSGSCAGNSRHWQWCFGHFPVNELE